jgi:phenylpropionate dioxygenase-like ring-hydroxylating dioxygenase large terminal subunit
LEHAKQVELIHRVLEHLRTGTTHMVENEDRLPVAPYIQPERFEAERRLFRKLPLIVGHVSQLAEPGDYFTHDATGTPLLLCRTAAGEVVCFLNVCRHRGTRLVPEAQGRRKQAFVCPYHGWTYDSTGRLRAVPDEVGFPSRPSESVGLVRVPVAERLGLLWVTLEPGGPDVDTFLAPVAAELAGFGLDTLVAYKPHRMERKLNWKIAIEIFLEAYHLKYAHRQSIYPLFFNNVGLVDRLSPHIRGIFPKRTIQELAGKPKSEWVLRQHANVLYQLFPNVLLLVQPDHVSVSVGFPKGTDATDCHTFWLLPQLPTTEKATRYWEKNMEILVGAISEDLAMGESIQSGLRSGANEFVRLARFEHGLRYFRDDLDAFLARCT